MKSKTKAKQRVTLLLVIALLLGLAVTPATSSYAADDNTPEVHIQNLDLSSQKFTWDQLLHYNFYFTYLYQPLNLKIETLFLKSLADYFILAQIAHQQSEVFVVAEENPEENIKDEILKTFQVSSALDEIALQKTELIARGKNYYLKDLDNNILVRGSNLASLIRTEDKAYCVSTSGALKQGFCKLGEFYYYSEAEKGLARGWRELDGKYYYFSPVDCRMYRDGMFSTGEGVYWFGEDGAVKAGERLGGHVGLPITWQMPTPEELTNKWLEGDNQKLRFRGQEIANYAASFEGLPFKWFGNDLGDESGVYCCGTVYAAHKAFGIEIPGPGDMDMELNEGFEMVKHQHDRVKEFGGELISNDLTKLLPGDVVLHMSPLSPIEYTHVGIFMGYNGDTPYYLHATIKDGVIVESVHMANEEWGAWFSDKFMRYNTEQNKGIEPYPRHQSRSKQRPQAEALEEADKKINEDETEQAEESEE